MPKSPDTKPAKPARGDKPTAAKAARAPKPAGEAVAAEAAAAPAKARPKPEAKATAKATSLAAGLKLRDLIDSVAAATGAKKPDAKIAVEATLAALAEALKAGSDMTLPPLGKIRVVKLAEKGDATMMTLKLRHGGGAGKGGSKPLAKDGEDD